jgi:hypothetical protein
MTVQSILYLRGLMVGVNGELSLLELSLKYKFQVPLDEYSNNKCGEVYDKINKIII